MTEPSLELQRVVRLRLVASSALTGLVPASAIVDQNNRPEAFPCILIGEGQTVPDAGIARNRHIVFADLHLWTKEPGVVVSKQIAGAIRSALADTRWTLNGFAMADLHIISTRFLRDPDGIHAHGVISISAQVIEVA